MASISKIIFTFFAGSSERRRRPSTVGAQNGAILESREEDKRKRESEYHSKKMEILKIEESGNQTRLEVEKQLLENLVLEKEQKTAKHELEMEVLELQKEKLMKDNS